MRTLTRSRYSIKSVKFFYNKSLLKISDKTGIVSVNNFLFSVGHFRELSRRQNIVIREVPLSRKAANDPKLFSLDQCHLTDRGGLDRKSQNQSAEAVLKSSDTASHRSVKNPARVLNKRIIIII